MEVVASLARCVLWYANIEDTGGALARWDTHFVSEEAARRVMPVAELPGHTYVQSAYLARIYEDERQYEAMVQEQLEKNEGFSSEFRCRMKDGSIRWFSEDVHIERAGPGRWRAVGVSLDITERRELEEQVRQAREHLERVVTSSPAVLFTAESAEPGAPLTWISPNVEEMLGYTVEEVFQPSWWRESVHPDDVERIAGGPAPGVNAGDRVAREFRFRHKDGTHRWVRAEVRQLCGAQGGASGIVGSWWDITQRKQLEEQFRQAQKMEAVGRLAGGVAHDFNNMLAVIIGYSELLLMQLPPDDRNRVAAREIQQAGERAANLTRQLLAFSRQQVLEPRLLDLREVVRGFEKMLRRLIGEDIDVATSVSPAPCQVLGDAGQIEQILLNLAVNARDAMPRGGRLTIGVQRVHLDEQYVQSHLSVSPGPYVVLSVSDTGCGMEGSTLSRVFEPFFTTKEQGKGTGLGLAMVYGIVKQSGGDVWVYSEPGRGTTFKVYLPAADGTAAEPVAPEANGALRGSETILVTEDEPMLRSLVRITLEEHGYQVLAVDGVREAAELMDRREQPIDLLLTDVVMPGMSGRELADRMRAARPETKVLFMSGYTDDAVVRHGVLHEGAAFLQKPFSPTVLARKVREVLDSGN
jgi:two-component system cell cycle sensor histidine kinase/response regulator CckA